jgi:hypothetical protein
VVMPSVTIPVTFVCAGVFCVLHASLLLTQQLAPGCLCGTLLKGSLPKKLPVSSCLSTMNCQTTIPCNLCVPRNPAANNSSLLPFPKNMLSHSTIDCTKRYSCIPYSNQLTHSPS